MRELVDKEIDNITIMPEDDIIEIKKGLFQVTVEANDKDIICFFQEDRISLTLIKALRILKDKKDYGIDSVEEDEDLYYTLSDYFESYD